MAEQGILVKEAEELNRALKRIAGHAAHVIRTQKSRARYFSNPYIGPHVRQVPSSVVNPLRIELERYNAVCDIIESKLVYAIATIRRDIEREKERLKREEEREAAAKVASQEDAIAPDGFSADDGLIPNLPAGVKLGAGLAGPPTGSRRGQPASLFSLRAPRHGAPFPLKLDLSATTLKSEKLMSGLFSPVTLAPKTGRPLPSGVEADSMPFSDFGNALADSESVPGLGPILDLPMAESTGPSNTGNMHDGTDMESLFGDVGSAMDTTGHPPAVSSAIPGLDAVGDAVSNLFSADPESNADQQLTELGEFSGAELGGGGPSLHQNPTGLDADKASVAGTAGATDTLALPGLGGEYDLGMDFQQFSPSMFDGFGDGEVPGLGESMEELLRGPIPGT